jgi:hypothetical protein
LRRNFEKASARSRWWQRSRRWQDAAAPSRAERWQLHSARRAPVPLRRPQRIDGEVNEHA